MRLTNFMGANTKNGLSHYHEDKRESPNIFYDMPKCEVLLVQVLLAVLDNDALVRV